MSEIDNKDPITNSPDKLANKSNVKNASGLGQTGEQMKGSQKDTGSHSSGNVFDEVHSLLNSPNTIYRNIVSKIDSAARYGAVFGSVALTTLPKTEEASKKGSAAENKSEATKPSDKTTDASDSKRTEDKKALNEHVLSVKACVVEKLATVKEVPKEIKEEAVKLFPKAGLAQNLRILELLDKDQNNPLLSNEMRKALDSYKLVGQNQTAFRLHTSEQSLKQPLNPQQKELVNNAIIDAHKEHFAGSKKIDYALVGEKLGLQSEAVKELEKRYKTAVFGEDKASDNSALLITGLGIGATLAGGAIAMRRHSRMAEARRNSAAAEVLLPEPDRIKPAQDETAKPEAAPLEAETINFHPTPEMFREAVRASAEAQANSLHPAREAVEDATKDTKLAESIDSTVVGLCEDAVKWLPADFDYSNHAGCNKFIDTLRESLVDRNINGHNDPHYKSCSATLDQFQKDAEADTTYTPGDILAELGLEHLIPIRQPISPPAPHTPATPANAEAPSPERTGHTGQQPRAMVELTSPPVGAPVYNPPAEIPAPLSNAERHEVAARLDWAINNTNLDLNDPASTQPFLDELAKIHDADRANNATQKAFLEIIETANDESAINPQFTVNELLQGLELDYLIPETTPPARPPKAENGNPNRSNGRPESANLPSNANTEAPRTDHANFSQTPAGSHYRVTDTGDTEELLNEIYADLGLPNITHAAEEHADNLRVDAAPDSDHATYLDARFLAGLQNGDATAPALTNEARRQVGIYLDNLEKVLSSSSDAARANLLNSDSAAPIRTLLLQGVQETTAAQVGGSLDSTANTFIERLISNANNSESTRKALFTVRVNGDSNGSALAQESSIVGSGETGSAGDLARSAIGTDASGGIKLAQVNLADLTKLDITQLQDERNNEVLGEVLEERRFELAEKAKTAELTNSEKAEYGWLTRNTTKYAAEDASVRFEFWQKHTKGKGLELEKAADGLRIKGIGGLVITTSLLSAAGAGLFIAFRGNSANASEIKPTRSKTEVPNSKERK